MNPGLFYRQVRQLGQTVTLFRSGSILEIRLYDSLRLPTAPCRGAQGMKCSPFPASAPQRAEGTMLPPSCNRPAAAPSAEQRRRLLL